MSGGRAASERLRTALAAIEGVVEGDSQFKDELAYWVNGTEVAHFEGKGAIDIRLTRAGIRERRPELRADPRVVMRPGSSDWIGVHFSVAEDEALVRERVEAAATRHRAAPGTIPAPPGRRRTAGPR